jgi:hypothetical protein
MTIDNQNVGLRRIRRRRPTWPSAGSADGSDNLRAYRNSKNSKGRTYMFAIGSGTVASAHPTLSAYGNFLTLRPYRAHLGNTCFEAVAPIRGDIGE